MGREGQVLLCLVQFNMFFVCAGVCVCIFVLNLALFPSFLIRTNKTGLDFTL